MANEQVAEVRGAHLPKITEGGAASVVIAQAVTIKDGPAPIGTLISVFGIIMTHYGNAHPCERLWFPFFRQ